MIFYLVADHPAPSWGTGMLYEHVRLLREMGREASVLHHCSPYRPGWRELEVPVRYLDEPGFAPSAADVVVVPEVLAASEAVQRHPWRRIVFVQGSFLIVRGMDGGVDYAALGYEAAMAVLPHVAAVIERHFGLSAEVVPPFIAPYFFQNGARPRQRRVLLAVKEGYRLAGVPDEEIAGALLAKEIARRPDWSLVPLEGLTHREVAGLMQASMFLVNVHSHEGFNTTVPEAMAAGCIPVCYEAGGGRDFLRDGENAVVFPNQDVYALVERICDLLDLIERCDEHAPFLARLRAGGETTAASFRPELTARALARFFSVYFPR
ncbi:MAG TPA: glycosyltransferase [Thermoanaerobaculia bacterium]|nr:glycosyltransferase [Thermoanaerobaculia bacterium]